MNEIGQWPEYGSQDYRNTYINEDITKEPSTKNE